jgi:hypothetical protein
VPASLKCRQPRFRPGIAILVLALMVAQRHHHDLRRASKPIRACENPGRRAGDVNQSDSDKDRAMDP